jgi:nucleotide-binding universal stress UspA family protein
MKSTFEAACSARNVTAVWRELDAGTHSVADVVVGQAHSADLVIAAQTGQHWPGARRLDIADRLVMESGRPVLIVPNGTDAHMLPRNILVAWNGRREAARAVFDALPLLQRADAVRVVWVNAQAEDGTMQSAPASDICIALARHGVNCEATQVARPFTNVGRALLHQAVDHRADLLVMGCYGHSRAREFIFGGASEYVLQQMSLPVLMTH